MTLHSIHHSLHPEPGPDDLAEAITDMRAAWAELYGEVINTPIPEDRRHAAKVIRRRAVCATDYARWAQHAAWIADQIADRED